MRNRNTLRSRSTLMLGVCALALTACSGPDTRAIALETVDTGYKVDAELVRFGDRDGVRAGGVQVSDEVYVGATPQRLDASASLPRSLQNAGAVTLRSSEPMTLAQIASRLGEMTGISHTVSFGPGGGTRVSGGVSQQLAGGSDGCDSPGDIASDGSVCGARAASVRAGGSSGTFASGPVSADTAQASSEAAAKTMIPNLRGPLSAVLNEVSAAFDTEWSYENGRVVFREFVTRQYKISALPSASSGSVSMEGSGMITSSSDMSLDVWNDIKEAVGGLVQGGTIAISPSTGVLTVTARSADHDLVERYVKDMNGVVGGQVSFDVNVITVALSAEESYGIDLRSILSDKTTNDFGSIEAGGGVGSVNIGIVKGALDVRLVARALASKGHVSIDTRAGATTSSNKITPINVTKTKSYVTGTSAKTDDDGDVDYDVTTKEVVTGFEMQLLPRIVNNREIMLNYALRLSELDGIETVSAGGNTIQLPSTSETSFEQQAVLENGQTLVMAGFERNRSELESSGFGRGMQGVGGVRGARSERVATVILITPKILKRQANR